MKTIYVEVACENPLGESAVMVPTMETGGLCLLVFTKGQRLTTLSNAQIQHLLGCRAFCSSLAGVRIKPAKYHIIDDSLTGFKFNGADRDFVWALPSAPESVDVPDRYWLTLVYRVVVLFKNGRCRVLSGAWADEEAALKSAVHTGVEVKSTRFLPGSLAGTLVVWA